MHMSDLNAFTKPLFIGHESWLYRLYKSLIAENFQSDLKRLSTLFKTSGEDHTRIVFYYGIQNGPYYMGHIIWAIFFGP